MGLILASSYMFVEAQNYQPCKFEWYKVEVPNYVSNPNSDTNIFFPTSQAIYFNMNTSNYINLRTKRATHWMKETELTINTIHLVVGEGGGGTMSRFDNLKCISLMDLLIS